MRLTQTIRDAYVKGIMADVPYVDYEERASKIARQTVIDNLPEQIRKLYIDPKFSGYVNTSNYESCSFFIAERGHKFGRVTNFPCSENMAVKQEFIQRVTALLQPDLQSLYDKSKAQYDQRQELIRTVTALANSVGTVKALREAMPEFGKYLPTEFEKAKHSLVVIQDVAKKFKEAGWPGGKKPAEASNDIAGAINLAIQAA